MDQSGPGSNGNERVLYTIQSSRIGTTALDAVYCHTQDTPLFWDWSYPSYLGWLIVLLTDNNNKKLSKVIICLEVRKLHSLYILEVV